MSVKENDLILWLRSDIDLHQASLSGRIGHFTVVYSVTRPMNGSEAAGNLVLIQTSLFLSCKLCGCDAN